MILQEHNTLANGMTIPKLGLGTWFIEDEKAAEAVRFAVAMGYRLIDTAQAYGNERGVGEGVRTCEVPRESLFVASKVAAELKTYEAAAKSIDETLKKMGLDYLDQMIIHSPQPWKEFRGEKRYFAENRDLACLGRCTDSRQSTGDWCFQFPDRRFGKSDAGLSGKADGKPDSVAYNIFPVFSGKPLKKKESEKKQSVCSK